MYISEIFYSIQGETSYIGLPCVFIRTAGCSIGCSYCDTSYARDGGDDLTIEQILDHIYKWQCRLALITGGEPLEQAEDVTILCEALNSLCYKILLETSGIKDISSVKSKVTFILDIKCPSSGVSHLVKWQNLKHLKNDDQIKFVVANREDYEWSKMNLYKYKITDVCKEILFSPVYGILPPEDLAEWILEDNLSARLNLQLHKIIWPGRVRGV